MLDDELTLPFIFVADGADPPPELAEFKSAHPEWVSFPATFIPHEQPVQEGKVLRTQPASEQAWEPPPRKKPTPPQPTTRTDLGAALRAFQRANAEHPDPVKALRALRDAPEDFDDGSSGSARQSTPDQLSAPQRASSEPAVGQSGRLAQVRRGTNDSSVAIDIAPDEKTIQTVADEGTPGNNQVQNAQVRAVVRILGLTRAQREQLHREISGRDYNFQQVLEAAKDLFGE